MCGRITLTRPNLESVTSELNIAPEGCRGYPILQPHYNIAPPSLHPILTLDDKQRSISPMTWGSIPKSGRGLTINWRPRAFRPRPRAAELSPTAFMNGPDQRPRASRIGFTGPITGWW
jgi:putative SOS response-associated peptidase YedK